MTTAVQPAGRRASRAKGCHRKASRRASCHHQLCILQRACSMPSTKVPLLPSPAFDPCSVPREFTQRTTLCCLPLLPLAAMPGSTEPGLQKEHCCSTERSSTVCRPPASHCCSRPTARSLLLLHARAAASALEVLSHARHVQIFFFLGKPRQIDTLCSSPCEKRGCLVMLLGALACSHTLQSVVTPFGALQEAGSKRGSPGHRSSTQAAPIARHTAPAESKKCTYLCV